MRCVPWAWAPTTFAKPFEPELLALTIDRAFRLHDLQQENAVLQLQQGSPLDGFLTRDPVMLKLCRTIEKIANANVTAMLLGESGTGKKSSHEGSQPVAAKRRAFRRHQLRRDSREPSRERAVRLRKGFHRRGEADLGKIEVAHRGTLFLDEIGDLPMSLQSKLLRFLQERVIERIGVVKRSRSMCGSSARPTRTSRA